MLVDLSTDVWAATITKSDTVKMKHDHTAAVLQVT